MPRSGLLPVMALGALLSSGAWAASYDEALSGDISGDRLQPTRLILAAGGNLVSGRYGRADAGGIDVDYLRITLPAGHALTALEVLPGTTHGGGRSFIGVQAGTQLTVTRTAAEPADLLGYAHFTAVSSPLDILADMGDPLGEGFGAQGFAPPLDGADYTFWIMETQASEAFDYRFNFQVSAVPLPPAVVGLSCALLSLVVTRRRPSVGAP